MPEILTSAIEFLGIIKREEIVHIQFVKKDNTVRFMKCTLDFKKIPKEKIPKGVNLEKILKNIKDNKILSVFDIEKQDWRSVPFDRLQYLQIPSTKKLYLVKKIK